MLKQKVSLQVAKEPLQFSQSIHPPTLLFSAGLQAVSLPPSLRCGWPQEASTPMVSPAGYTSLTRLPLDSAGLPSPLRLFCQ